MTEKDKYKLSTYNSIELLHETETSRVELVESSLDGIRYIKKTYNSDKRAIYNSLSKIKTTHIPEIYEVIFGEDTIIIEQYIEGKTLEEKIINGYEFSQNEIKVIIKSLLDAISTLHKNNIVHRDIKPSNIIINEKDEAVLIDYSIARPYSDKRDADTELFGTVGYAAPEQFGFSQSDYRTDIYALGVTLKKIINHKNASQRIRNAVSRCMEFDPSRRFQSIDEIRQYINRSKYYAGLFFTIGIIAAIGAAFAFIPKNDETVVINNETEVAQQIHISETETTTNTYIESEVATTESGAKSDSVEYDLYSSRIVSTPHNESVLPCIRMWEDGEYEADLPLGDNTPPVKIAVQKSDNKCTVTVNNTAFEFEDTYTHEVLSYPDSEKVAEIVFYDMNGDAILDILPFISDACIVNYYDGPDLHKNYSVAWCIYSDSQGEYTVADGEMYTYFEPFSIYESSPGCVWANFPSYYKLEGGKLNLYQ